MIKGQVVGGDFSKIIARQKSGQNIELGELLVADCGEERVLFQVVDLGFASQLSKQNLELISGMFLEEEANVDFMEPELRNYKMAVLKSVLHLRPSGAVTSKSLPDFFSTVNEVEEEDMRFLTKPDNPLSFGKVRSGSKVMDIPIYMDGSRVLSEHILLAATTGRGKSNLTKCVLWDSVDKDYCGTLVLDPHDEYYGRNGIGLKDHPKAQKVTYYTPKNAPPGGRTLKINLGHLKPKHFDGTNYWSDPQRDALYTYYKKYKDKWIEAIILEKPLDQRFNEATIGVIRRKIMYLLDLEYSNNYLVCNGIFDLKAGTSTVEDVINELDEGRTVIIDTSGFSGSSEILIGSIVLNEVLNRHKKAKSMGELAGKPVVSVVLEEAPRVLGKEVLDQGPNVFATIAREGRKFKVGLFAITQLPSLIPRQILANMNTKIIMGIEMNPERQAIIESASQDLSDDSRNIASLDKGEAIISSNFSKFAMPIKMPLFREMLSESKEKKEKKDFTGVKLS
ncbi:MAG: ATP-binding protein [Candidatus Nanoarchaeia archaeon]